MNVKATIQQEGGINESQDIEIWLSNAEQESGIGLIWQNVQITEEDDGRDLVLTAELTNQSDVAVTPMGTLQLYSRLTNPFWSIEVDMGKLAPNETKVINQPLSSLSDTEREQIGFAISNNSLKAGVDFKHPNLSDGQLLEQSIDEISLQSN